MAVADGQQGNGGGHLSLSLRRIMITRPRCSDITVSDLSVLERANRILGFLPWLRGLIEIEAHAPQDVVDKAIHRLDIAGCVLQLG